MAYCFTEQDIQEIKDAVAAVEQRDLKVGELSKQGFTGGTCDPLHASRQLGHDGCAEKLPSVLHHCMCM